MSPASKRLIVIGLALAASAPLAPLPAQARNEATPRPGAWTGAPRERSRFDPIARRVLTLQLEVATLRDRLTRSRADWPMPGWGDSLAAMRGGIEVLRADAQRLEQGYASAHDTRGQRLASQLRALVERVRGAFIVLARARDPRTARTALAHLGAGLEALEQEIAEGEACCP